MFRTGQVQVTEPLQLWTFGISRRNYPDPVCKDCAWIESGKLVCGALATVWCPFLPLCPTSRTLQSHRPHVESVAPRTPRSPDLSCELLVSQVNSGDRG